MFIRDIPNHPVPCQNKTINNPNKRPKITFHHKALIINGLNTPSTQAWEFGVAESLVEGRVPVRWPAMESGLRDSLFFSLPIISGTTYLFTPITS